MTEILPNYSPSTLESIDTSVYNWIKDELNIHVNTHEGVFRVPINFASPERAFLSKIEKDNRDNKFTLKYPIISIMRQDIKKYNKKNGSLQGTAFKNASTTLVLPIHKELNKEKTSDRSNADIKKFAGTLNLPKFKTKRPIYDIYSIPIPSFIEIPYEISCISNFQSQMNEILNVFIKYSSNTNGFKLLNNGHVYEAFIDESISNKSNLDDISETERVIEYSFILTIKGYIHHGDVNDKAPTVIRQETIPEINFSTEYIFTGSL